MSKIKEHQRMRMVLPPMQRDNQKDIACLRGKSGWVNIRRIAPTTIFKLIIRDKEINRICSVDMYPHEAMKLYEFLGK